MNKPNPLGFSPVSSPSSPLESVPAVARVAAVRPPSFRNDRLPGLSYTHPLFVIADSFDLPLLEYPNPPAESVRLLVE